MLFYVMRVSSVFVSAPFFYFVCCGCFFFWLVLVYFILFDFAVLLNFIVCFIVVFPCILVSLNSVYVILFYFM